MTEACTVRPVERADIPAVLAMLREMAEYERLLDSFAATEEAMAGELFADAPQTHAAIAEIEGLPVGFAIWMFFFHTFSCQRGLFVEDVFVREAERGGGIGYALFRHMAREALARGCVRMEWHVLDWNDLALRFYDRLGATPPPRSWVARQLTGDALAALATG